MSIYSILNESQIIYDLKGQSKEEVISELIESLKFNKQIIDIQKMKAAIIDREKLLSTGIGKGFAIPHCKTNAVEGIVVAFGKTIFPIEFDSIDSKPVHLVLLIASNDKINSEPLKLLSKVGNLISNEAFINKLLNTKSSAEILNTFKEAEK